MTETKHIHGLLSLTAPLHVAAPGDYHVTLDEERGVSAPKVGRAPQDKSNYGCTALQTMRVAVSEDERQARAENPAAARKSNVEELPFISANSIRGRLRRAACDVVFEALTARGEKLSLGAYHGMMCGAVTGRPSKRLTFDYIQAARKHPFLGVFGGGPGLVPSSARIHIAWPIVAATVDGGFIPAKFADGATVGDYGNTFRLRQVLFQKRIDDAIVFRGVDSVELIVKDYAKELVEWAKVVAPVKDEAGKVSRPKDKLENFVSFEIVVPGTKFYLPLELDIEHVGLAGYGLFLQALSLFVKKHGRFLGGMARHGFGAYSAKWTDDGGGRVLTDLGEPNSENESVAEALAAWEEAKGAISAAEIETLYALEKTDEAIPD